MWSLATEMLVCLFLYLFVYAYNVIELSLNRLICLNRAKFEKSIFKAIYFCRHFKAPVTIKGFNEQGKLYYHRY